MVSKIHPAERRAGGPDPAYELKHTRARPVFMVGTTHLAHRELTIPTARTCVASNG